MWERDGSIVCGKNSSSPLCAGKERKGFTVCTRERGGGMEG